MSLLESSYHENNEVLSEQEIPEFDPKPMYTRADNGGANDVCILEFPETIQGYIDRELIIMGTETLPNKTDGNYISSESLEQPPTLVIKWDSQSPEARYRRGFYDLFDDEIAGAEVLEWEVEDYEINSKHARQKVVERLSNRGIGVTVKFSLDDSSIDVYRKHLKQHNIEYELFPDYQNDQICVFTAPIPEVELYHGHYLHDVAQSLGIEEFNQNIIERRLAFIALGGAVDITEFGPIDIEELSHRKRPDESIEVMHEFASVTVVVE